MVCTKLLTTNKINHIPFTKNGLFGCNFWRTARRIFKRDIARKKPGI
jgi:hypothetical protein